MFDFMPFSLPNFTPKMGSKKEAAYLNSIQGINTYKMFNDIMLSRFKYENLPETCNERALEITLCYYGYALFFEDENLGLIHTPCNLQGPFNIYYESINRDAYSYAYHARRTIDDSVLIRCNKTMIGDYVNLVNYIPKIVNAIRSVDVHTNTIKKPFMIVASEKELPSVKRALNAIDDNESAVVGSKLGNPDSFQVLSLVQNSFLSEMWGNVKNYYQQLYTALGVVNTYSQKKERLVVSESVGEENSIRHILESELSCREEAIYNVNKMFGTNIRVTANQLERFNDEQIYNFAMKNRGYVDYQETMQEEGDD